MRKKSKAILLGTAMLASMLTGCGGAEGAAGQPATAEEGERMTLQLWTSSRDAIDHPDAWYIKKIEDEFDVNIEMQYRNEGGTDYSEWLTLSLAGDDCPDWFRDQTVSTSMLNDLVKQGLVAKLDPEWHTLPRQPNTDSTDRLSGYPCISPPISYSWAYSPSPSPDPASRPAAVSPDHSALM